METFLPALLALTHDVLAVCDAEMKIIAGNRAADACFPGGKVMDEKLAEGIRHCAVSHERVSGIIHQALLEGERQLREFAVVPHGEHLLLYGKDVTDLAQLREENDLFRKIVDNARTGITVADMTRSDGVAPIFVNATFSRLTGYGRDEAIGNNLRFLQGDDRDQPGVEVMARAIAACEPCEVTLRNYKKSGEMFWNMISLSPIFDEEGALHYYVGTQHDITRLKVQEQQLEEQHRFIQTVMDAQPNMILITAGDHLEYANKSFLDFFECEDTEAFKREYGCVCNGFVQNERFFHMGKVNVGESWIDVLSRLEPHEQIVSLLCPNLEGKAFKVEVRDYDDEHHILTFTDISDNLMKQIEAEDAANTDGLTGLHNRQFFEKHARLFVIDAEVRQLQAGIILFDIDHFKSINDRFGHNAGDAVLSGVARAVRQSVRSKDMLIRWGGEEFLVMAAVKTPDQLFSMAEKLRRTVAGLKCAEGVNVTASFGVSAYDAEKTMIENISAADTALYASKRNGRNRTTGSDGRSDGPAGC